MTSSSTPASARPGPWWTLAFAGLYAISWPTVALIVAINTGYAAMMSIEDPRPFWHPFISAQCFGLLIAYAVNVASPWENPRPIGRLCAAVAIGTGLAIWLLPASVQTVSSLGFPRIAWLPALWRLRHCRRLRHRRLIRSSPGLPGAVSRPAR